MSQTQGYWSGMTGGMKVRLIAFLIYLAISLVVLAQSPILGIVLLVLPVIWAVFMLWFSAETYTDVGPLSLRKSSVLGYTLRYLWRSSVIARVVMSVAGAAAVIGGLGYISTEKLREAAAKPTLTERAVAMTESATEATKVTTSGWVQTAKGWFTSDETPDDQ